MMLPYSIHSDFSSTSAGLRSKGLDVSSLKSLICFIMLMMAVFSSVARPSSAPSVREGETVADSTEIHFRQSSSRLDLGFDGNGARLDSLLRQIREISGQDSTYVLSTLRVIGSASPEGSEKINRQLSEKRAKALFDYFADHISLPESITDFEYLGRNWKGLYQLVAADNSVPYQSDVLALLQKGMTSDKISAHESNHLLYQLKNLK